MAMPGWLSRDAEDGDDFVYTEFFVKRTEPLPRRRFGNGRFMWGCVALAVVFGTWLSRE